MHMYKTIIKILIRGDKPANNFVIHNLSKDLEPFVKAMYRNLEPFVEVLTYQVLRYVKYQREQGA